MSGTGTVTLTGTNSYTGGTTLAAGRLLLGNDLALGTGALHVTAASSLAGTTTTNLANAIDLGANLTLDGLNAMTLNGIVSGSGVIGLGAAGTLPQCIDDQQQHADHAGTDTDPGDQLIAGDHCGYQRSQADDGKHKRNDQHRSTLSVVARKRAGSRQCEEVSLAG